MSERTPLDLVVAAFGTERAAETAFLEMLAKDRNVLAGIKEAAIVVRDAGGRMHITERNDMGSGGVALGGATTGALIGLLAGPIGALVGAATGGLIGGVAGRFIDTGIPDEQLRQIAEALKPGTSALVTMTEQSASADFRVALAGAGGTVMSSPLREDVVEQLAAHGAAARSAGEAGGATDRGGATGDAGDQPGTAGRA
jgi:uncharacterized membrane protein